MPASRSTDIARAVCGLAVCLWLATSSALAQEWPKQITIVVPFPPGASNDTFARILAQKLSPKLGATIIVDNKAGAGGSIGAASVAKAAPNGATLLLTSSTFTGNAAVQPKLPFDPVADLVPVAQLAKGPMIVAVGPDTPYKSLAELIAAARAEKGKLNYGTAGVGSINHMATEMLNTMAQVEMTHVPYRGISNVVTDLISGQVQLVISSFPSIAELVTAGKLRGLAVTSAQRSSFAPELPAVAETVSGYDVDLWWGVFAPAGLPAAMVEQLNKEIRAIITDDDMRQRFAQEGALPTPVSAAEFAGVVRADLDKWRKVAKERDITIR
jgi:tripartite-type tricarboxylate transporter receptor subunit TctC